MAKRTKTRTQGKQALNGTTLRTAVTWIVDAKIFAHWPVHGNTSWEMLDLILSAVVWVWSADPTLTGAFTEAERWSMHVLGRAAVHTYQALLKALVTWTATLLPALWQRLQQRMAEQSTPHRRVGRWVALAVDGSRISVPCTKANEAAFCAPHCGKGKTAKYRKKKSEGQRRRRKTKPQPVKPQL